MARPSLRVTTDGDTTEAVLSGRLDAGVVRRLEEVLERLLRDPPAVVRVDVREVRGLDLVTACALRRAGVRLRPPRRMIVVGARGQAGRLLADAGITVLLAPRSR